MSAQLTASGAAAVPSLDADVGRAEITLNRDARRCFRDPCWELRRVDVPRVLAGTATRSGSVIASGGRTHSRQQTPTSFGPSRPKALSSSTRVVEARRAATTRLREAIGRAGALVAEVNRRIERQHLGDRRLPRTSTRQKLVKRRAIRERGLGLADLNASKASVLIAERAGDTGPVTARRFTTAAGLRQAGDELASERGVVGTTSLLPVRAAFATTSTSQSGSGVSWRRRRVDTLVEAMNGQPIASSALAAPMQ